MKAASASPSKRVRGYDTIRGFSVLSMTGFHTCYDLVYIYGMSLPWFRPPLQDIWRASISWTFLVLAGIMCAYSRSNLKRAAKYLLVALAIWVATSIASLDTPINFGIIYCMGFSTLSYWAISHLSGLISRKPQAQNGKANPSASRKPSGAKRLLYTALALLVAFVLCLDVPNGRFGLSAFGGPSLAIARQPYDCGALSWLGFPGPGFSSGDYYTPLPYTLLFLAGACVGNVMKLKGTPRFLKELRLAPLEWVGRHALEFYVLHQPIVLMLCELFSPHQAPLP